MFSGEISTLVSLLESHALLAYGTLFALMVFEGDTALIVAGVLTQLGALSLTLVLLVSFIAVMLGDILWYFLGVFLRDRPFAAKYIRIIERMVGRLLPQFREKPLASLVLAKYIYGTNHATLVLSGVIGMNFKLFFKAELIASAIWVALLSFLGYFFGYIALEISNQVSIFSLIVLILVFGFTFAEEIFGKLYEFWKKKRN